MADVRRIRIALALPFALALAPTRLPAATAQPAPSGDPLARVQRVDASTSEEVQTALALAAGPPVASGAAVYVLGPTGYRKAREGTNGFTCLVTRERLDTMEPECYDAEGTATTLKSRLFVEEMRAQGKDEAWIAKEVEKGYASGRFTAPKRPGLVYMLSDYNYVFDPDGGKVIHFPGHLMFYAPNLTAKDVGSGPGAPYLVRPGHPDALMIVVPARMSGH
jgi:hypothetical protein